MCSLTVFSNSRYKLRKIYAIIVLAKILRKANLYVN